MSANPDQNRLARFFFTFVVLPLLFIAGVQLFILSEQTEQFFAWTIPLSLTAAFMGAGYWAAMAHSFVNRDKSSWERVRVALPAAFTATTLLMIATLLHLDKFHLNSLSLLTRFVTWVWIVVYTVTPPVFLFFLLTKFRGAIRKNERGNTFPVWIRRGFYTLAVFGLLFGLGLFFLPQSFMPLSPWPLMPLASRAVGAWLTTFGVSAATLAWDNDRINGAGALASLYAFCVLQVVALLRYPKSLDFTKPLAWGYFLFLLLGLVASGVGLLKRRE